MFDTREKKERALGVKLGLKPFRSESPKSAFLRRPHKPGAHGKRRSRGKSEYGKQLVEKQKIRFTYGVRNRQLSNIFKEAMKHTGVTGDVVLQLLEKRLDNVVYRMGIAPSRSIARHMVSYGHIVVNGKKTTVPSYRVRINDVIEVRKESRGNALFSNLTDRIKDYQQPAWFSFDESALQGRVLGDPKDFDVQFDVGLVVDYYSK